jgi:hypothetical protein
MFYFLTLSLLALGPNQVLIQWATEALSPAVKRPGRESYHSPPSSAEVKNGGAIPSFHHTSSWRGV